LLVDGIEEAERGAQVEPLDPVDALTAGVGGAGEDGVEDLLTPFREGLAESDQFGDVLVGLAPVLQVVPALLDLGLGREVSGAVGPQGEDVAEVFFGDPGQGEVFQVGVVGEDVPELVVLVVGEVFQIAEKEAFNAVFGVGFAGSAAVVFTDESLPDLGDGAVGDLDDMERVGAEGRVGQCDADGGAECRAATSVTLRPWSATARASRRRNRSVVRLRTPTSPVASTNDCRSQVGDGHTIRRLSHINVSGRSPNMTSRIGTGVVSFDEPDNVPQAGHGAVAASAVMR
jgi:hypothetical protein